MKIVCLDIDGCLANFTKAYAKLLIKVGGNKLPHDWETNPEFPKVWYWEREAGYPKEVEQEVWQTHILQKNSTFWQTLEPLPTAKESLMVLNGLEKAGKVHCVFLTHRMGDRAHLQTCEFLYENGFDYPTVLLAADKTPYLRLLQAHFFLDDKPDTVLDVAKKRQDEKWGFLPHLCLKTAPYNKELQAQVGLVKIETAATVKEALQQAGIWE